MPTLFSTILYNYFSKRTSMARACASRPSVRANVVMCVATSSNRSFVNCVKDVRFTKSYTPSGDEKRAVPLVGNT